MDLSHIFYKVLPADGGNTFLLTLYLGKNNEIEEVLLKEDQNYMFTAVSINRKKDTDVIIPGLNARKFKQYDEIL